MTGLTFASVHNCINELVQKDIVSILDVIKSSGGRKATQFAINSAYYSIAGIYIGDHKISVGGMLLDWGVHMLDQIMYMVPKKVVNVFAWLYSIKTPEVDDYFKSILTFESGLNAQIEVDHI